MDSGANLVWSAIADSTKTGALVTFTFEVSSEAEAGDYNIDIISRECFNADGDVVGVNFEGAKITLVDYFVGDVNGDGNINGKDVIFLRKYFADLDDSTGLSSVEITAGADANSDGKVDGRDLILLRKYMAYYNDETGTSDIVLGASKN